MTIPFGRVIQTVVLVIMLLIMMSLGTGQYNINGTPYDMVYLEKEYIAMKDGLDFWNEREKGITNQFVSTEAMAKVLALNNLFFEVMKEQPRTVILKYDPRYEPGDIIRLSTGVKLWVESARRTIRRASGDTSLIELTAYRCVL